MTCPAATYSEMLNHPLRLNIPPCDFLSQDSTRGIGHCNIDLLVYDEAQDAPIVQALMVVHLSGDIRQ